MLDEFCEHYRYERKHAIKLLGDALPKARGQVRCGPEPVYEPVRTVVERIWQASEQLCGKRLAPALELWLPHYGKHYGGLLPTQKKLLQKVSAATLDRMLAPIKAQGPRRLCGTRPGTLLRTQIPIQGEVWDEQRAGFLEADSVRVESGRRLHLEPDLHLFGQRLDRRPGRVEQGGGRGGRANQGHGNEPALCAPGDGL